MVVRDLDHRLPAETRRIMDEGQLRLCPTVERDVEPVVFLETLCRLVLVVAERDLTHRRTTFHFDEPNVGEGLLVVWVRLPGDDVEAPIILFDAFNHPAALGLMPDRLLDGDSL